mgnify:FL=1
MLFAGAACGNPDSFGGTLSFDIKTPNGKNNSRIGSVINYSRILLWIADNLK